MVYVNSRGLGVFICCSLTVPPAQGEIMVGDFAIDSLPGNPDNLTDYITISPSTVYWAANNFSSEVDLTIDTSSACPVLLHDLCKMERHC